MDIEEYARTSGHFWHTSAASVQLRQLLDTGSFTSMVDVGCGGGAVLYALKALGYLDRFDTVCAVDLSQTRLADVAALSSTIRTVCDDAQTLSSLADNSFDLVMSTAVIEHVPDDKAMLRAMYRVCRPGGTVYLTTLLKAPWAWYYCRNPHGRWALDPTHEREYVKQSELLDGVHAAGLRMERSTKAIMAFSPVNALARTLRLGSKGMYANPVLAHLGRIKVPIPGYWTWRLVLKKP